MPDESRHRFHLGHFARRTLGWRRHGPKLECHVGVPIEMVRRYEARGRSACLTGEGPSARGTHDVARVPRSAVDASAHDIFVKGKPKRSKLRARAVEKALRLFFERPAWLAFQPNISEPLTLPVVDSLAH